MGVRDAASSSLKAAKKKAGIQSSSSEDSSVVDSLGEMCPKLTYQQRMIGFGACYSLGFLISLLSFTFFIELIEGDPVPFVLLYTFGNILSLGSSMFLAGPKKQMKGMFDEKRKFTSITYLSSLLLTLVVAFIKFDDTIKLLLLLVLVFVQFCASTWYMLSYIPFGRKTATNFAKSTLGMGSS